MNEIGQKLREARIEKGYTLDDLQQTTKIQKRYLMAIEEGNFDALPGSFYVRAFVKQYAQTVGLDSQALLAEYQDAIPDPKPEQYVEKSVENQTRMTRETTDSNWSKWRRLMPQFIIVAIVVVIVGIVYGVALSHRNKDRQTLNETSSSVTVSGDKTTTTKQEDKASKAAASKAASKTSKKSTKKATTEKKKTETKKLTASMTGMSGTQQTFSVKNLPSTANKLTFTAKDKAAWVSLTVNGSTTWQASVAAGASETTDLPAGITSFAIQTGNAPATGLKINDTTVNLSPNNEADYVRTITFNVAAN